MQTLPSHPFPFALIADICEYGGAIFGFIGTILMSRRFVPNFVRGVLYAAAWPFMYVFGQGNRVRKFFIARARLQMDQPDSAADMTMGINLLIWAFFFQLTALILKALK